MTSQKSLKNKVNANDFLRSFVAILPFAVIAFVFLFVGLALPVMTYLHSQDYLTSSIHNEILLFTGRGMLSIEVLQIGMVLCGMLMALRQFSFLQSKKSVNVYLSMGISRETLYINRTISSIVTMFLSVVIPLTIGFLVNLANFGSSKQLIDVYIYGILLLTVAGISGFAFASFAMMITGHNAEAITVGAALSFLPTFIVEFAYNVANIGLVGMDASRQYSNDKWMGLLTPWGMAMNFHGEKLSDGLFNIMTAGHLFVKLENLEPEKPFKLLDPYKVDMSFYIPVIVWAIVSLLIIVGGIFLIRRRKAEHSKSFGNFTFSRIIISLTATFGVAFAAATAVFNSFYSYRGFNNSKPISLWGLWGIIIGVSLLATFIIQLIWTRKLRKTLKTLITWGVAASLITLTFVAVDTQLFGTFNNAFKKEEVESVTFDLKGVPFGYYHSNDPHKLWSQDEKDIDTALNILEFLKNDKTNSEKSDAYETVNVVFKLKNGKYKSRSFDIVTSKRVNEYYELSLNSNLFDMYLHAALLEKPEKGETNMHMHGQFKGSLRYNDVTLQNDYHEWILTNRYSVIDDENIEIDDYIIKFSEDFYKALYNDLSKMTYKELLKNDSAPLGILVPNKMPIVESMADTVIGSVKYDDVGIIPTQESKYAYSDIDIILYPEMTETLKFLKDNGYEVAPPITTPIKEIYLSENDMSFEDVAVEKVRKNDSNRLSFYMTGSYRFYGDRISGSFRFSDTSEMLDKKIKLYDGFMKVYKDMGYTLTKVQPENFQNIMDIVDVHKGVRGDKGRFAYIIYEDGLMLEYYIPERSLQKIK